MLRLRPLTCMLVVVGALLCSSSASAASCPTETFLDFNHLAYVAVSAPSSVPLNPGAAVGAGTIDEPTSSNGCRRARRLGHAPAARLGRSKGGGAGARAAGARVRARAPMRGLRRRPPTGTACWIRSSSADSSSPPPATPARPHRARRSPLGAVIGKAVVPRPDGDGPSHRGRRSGGRGRDLRPAERGVSQPAQLSVLGVLERPGVRRSSSMPPKPSVVHVRSAGHAGRGDGRRPQRPGAVLCGRRGVDQPGRAAGGGRLRSRKSRLARHRRSRRRTVQPQGAESRPPACTRRSSPARAASRTPTAAAPCFRPGRSSSARSPRPPPRSRPSPTCWRSPSWRR